MWQVGIPDGGEGGVRLERLGQVLRARGTDVVHPEPANEKGVGLSMAADGCQIGQVCGRRAGGGILK